VNDLKNGDGPDTSDRSNDRVPSTGKTHAITFRLGTREYEQLMKTIASRGSRSVSDFTRSAVLSSMVLDDIHQFLQEDLDVLMSTLDEFDTKVRNLRRQLRQLTLKSSAAAN